MLKILIVDDARIQRDMLRLCLQKAGYTKIAAAQDGSVALEQALRQQFDIIFTDINMPIMDGFELTNKLRAIESYKSTPIVAITTESSEDMKLKGKDCGTSGWIVKPFTLEQITAIIQTAIKK